MELNWWETWKFPRQGLKLSVTIAVKIAMFPTNNLVLNIPHKALELIAVEFFSYA